MDEIDETIVGLLQGDGRLTHRDIAHHTGLSRSATAARVQRLIATDQVAVRGVVHPTVLGRGSLAYVGLVVDGAASSLAAAVACRADTAFVSLASGHFGVLAEIRSATIQDVDEAVAELRSLPAVRTVDTVTYVEVVRDVVGPVGTVTRQVDATDRALLRALQRDGRASFVELGRTTGVSAAGARRRVLALIEAQVVRVGTIVRQSGSERQAAMGIGIRITGDHEPLVTALARLQAVTFVARTLGRFDILASLRAFDTAHLLDTLEAIRELPGVAGVDSWSHLRVVKESYAVGTL